MSLSREQLNKGFREGALDKKSLVIAVEVAIGLLLVALVAKHGKSLTIEVQEKVKELQVHKTELQHAIENDVSHSQLHSLDASGKATLLYQKYYELARNVDLDWQHKTIELLAYLPALLRHSGPKDG